MHAHNEVEFLNFRAGLHVMSTIWKPGLNLLWDDPDSPVGRGGGCRPAFFSWLQLSFPESNSGQQCFVNLKRVS